LRIAIVGAGGIGGLSAGSLARAGHDVRLFARGEHLAAIRRRGLEVREPKGSFTVTLAASDRPEDLGPADLAVVAVKSYSVAEVAPVVSLLAREGALVVPLLNGVEAFESLAERGVKAESMLGGLTAVSVAKIGPGVIERLSDFWIVVVGERAGGASDRAERAAAVFREAGADARSSADIQVDLWRKFLFLAPFAAVCGLARTSIGPVREGELGALLIDRAVREVSAVARARGVALPEDAEQMVLKRIAELPGSMKPSFLLDLERGGPNELDILSGAVSRMGRASGVPTPIHDTAAAAFSAKRAPR
jgi:2-dehydropantoate 2-reductase